MTPVRWLCGASGVGRSTVGREVFTQVQREAGELADLGRGDIRVDTTDQSIEDVARPVRRQAPLS